MRQKQQTKEAPKSVAPKTAAELIAVCNRRRAEQSLPSEEGLVELEKILKHNNSCARVYRVTALQAMDMLKYYGWVGGRQKFDRLIREHYGRSWGGEA